MLFKIHDKKEVSATPADVLTMRSMCFDALRRIQRGRKLTLESCDHRGFLSRASDSDRELFASAMIRTSMRAAHHSILPSPSAGAFLMSLKDQDADKGVAGRLASRIMGGFNEDPNVEVKREIENFLNLYPDFNPLTFRNGQRQSVEFMEQFEVDFTIIRETIFESRKPYTHLLVVPDSDFQELVKIHDEFTHEALGRHTIADIDEFLGRGFPRVTQHVNQDFNIM